MIDPVTIATVVGAVIGGVVTGVSGALASRRAVSQRLKPLEDELRVSDHTRSNGDATLRTNIEAVLDGIAGLKRGHERLDGRLVGLEEDVRDLRCEIRDTRGEVAAIKTDAARRAAEALVRAEGPRHVPPRRQRDGDGEPVKE